MNEPIRIDLTPGQEAIQIGEHDITNACRAITIRGQVGQRPTIDLEMCVHTIDVSVLGDPEPRVMVNLDDHTRRALVACGWTPPAPATY